MSVCVTDELYNNIQCEEKLKEKLMKAAGECLIWITEYRKRWLRSTTKTIKNQNIIFSF